MGGITILAIRHGYHLQEHLARERYVSCNVRYFGELERVERVLRNKQEDMGQGL